MLLSAIGKREVPIPEHIDIYHLTREMPPSDKTPLQCVMEVDTERAMLEREAERLAHEDGKAWSPAHKGHFLHFPSHQRKALIWVSWQSYYVLWYLFPPAALY